MNNNHKTPGNGSSGEMSGQNKAGEEVFSQRIEKVTQSLLNDWEVSEDDFMDTQDLAEAAAQIAAKEARERERAAVRRQEEELRSRRAEEPVRRREEESRARREEESVSRREEELRPRRAGERVSRQEEMSRPRRVEESVRRQEEAPRPRRSGESVSRREEESRPRRVEEPVSRQEEASRSRRAEESVSRREEEPRSRHAEESARRREEAVSDRRRNTESSKYREDREDREYRSDRERRADREERNVRGIDRSNTNSRRRDDYDERYYRRNDETRDTRNRRGDSARRDDRPIGSGSRRRKVNPVVEFWNGLQTMDKIVGFTGIAVCLFAIITFSVVLGARGVNRQVEAFAEVGENMSQIAVVDEGVFLAVADGHMARQQAADLVEDEESEYNETDDNSDIQVGLNMTSVEKDLKIKFVNRKTGKLIPYVNFQVEIKGPDKTYDKTDDDKDGIIYLTGISGGSYSVRIKGPENLDGYIIPTDAQSVTVKDKIEYKKIDVSDEIKAESEINASKEDTEIKTEVESVLKDTVEWVESTRTPVGGNESSAYTEVKKADVPDPATVASIDFALFAGIKRTVDGENQGMDGDIVPLTGSENTTPPSESGEGNGSSESGTGGGTSEEKPSESESKPEEGEKPSESESGSSQPSQPDPPADVAVTGITLSEKEHNATVGDSFSISATVSPENATNKSVSWASDNAGVASVDSSGKVTCQGAGKAIITATTSNGMSTSATINVSAKQIAVKEISISGDSQVAVGGTITLTASVSPSDATYDMITWGTSDSSIATVDGGKVKGVKAGEVTIKASAGGVENTKKIKVVSNEESKLEVKDMLSIEAGKTVKADYTAGNVSSVEFSIENTKYATIDKNGNIKAIRSGETKYTVSVKFKDGNKASETRKLIVKAAEVKKITLDKTKVTLKVGESLKLNPTIETTGYTGCLWYSSDQAIVSVEEHGGGTIKALKPGKVTITVKSSEDTSKTASCEVTVSGKDLSGDTTTPLKDKDGKQLYIKNKDGKFVAAVVADYYKYDVFYRANENVEYKYTGWQTIDGKRYFFDKNGNKVTGDQVIQGVKYSFGGDGALSAGNGVLGIDVSKHNGNINWAEVKNSGVSFVIIRCGYRGSATGALIEDPKFKTNIQGATAAGLKVGVYIFSQAVNRVEAVEEASMALAQIKNYKISYPVFIDVEAAGGRADGIDNGTRTEVINAFCNTIRDSGYTAGLYANKSWLSSKINTGSLGNTKIWLAQYAATPSYNGRYEMWQYSSTGRIGGISGNVDLNISFLGY